MSATVKNIEDRRYGNMYVDVNLEGKWVRFENAQQATSWLNGMKQFGSEVAEIFVEWLDVIITPRKEHVYRTNYVL